MSEAGEYIGQQLQKTTPERLSSNELLTAFNKAFGIYEEAISPLHKKFEESPDTLTPQEKRRLADFLICKNAKEQIIDQGKPYIEVPTDKGVFQEGIPVEGMIEVLEERIEELNDQLKLPDESKKGNISEELNTLKQLLAKIKGESLTFRGARQKLKLTKEQIEARTKAEAYFIFQDPLRRSTNPDNKKRREEDYYRSISTLKKRRELFFTPPEGAVSPEQPRRKPPTVEEIQEQISKLQEGLFSRGQLKELRTRLSQLQQYQQKLVEEIWRRGIGEEASRELVDLLRSLGETTLVYQLPDGKKINLASEEEGLAGKSFPGTEKDKDGNLIQRRLTKEAILFSPKLASELMDTLREMEDLERRLEEDKTKRRLIKNLRKKVRRREKKLLQETPQREKVSPPSENPAEAAGALPSLPEEAAPRISPQKEEAPAGEKPAGEREKVEKATPAVQPTEGAQTPSEGLLVTEFNFGFAADPRQITHEAQAGVDFQMQLHQREQKGLLRAIWGSFWQRGLLGPVFRAREENWRRKTLAAIGQHHLPNDLVERAMEEGKERVRQKKFRQKVGAFFRNLSSGLFGLNETAQQQEARKWLVDEVEKVQRRERAADETVKKFIEAANAEKSAFAARISLPDESFALNKGERRELIEGGVKDDVMKDFFSLVLDYINNPQITDEQVQGRIAAYCSDRGVDINGQKLRLSDRLGGRYPALASRLTLVGTNMLQIAKILRQQKEVYQQEGIVANPLDINSWFNALTHPEDEKRLKFNLYVAEAEISPGWKSPREESLRLLSERNEGYPGLLGNGSVKEAVGLLGRLGMSLGVNEVSAAVAGAYAGSLLTSFLPWNPAGRQAIRFAQMAGISVPLIVVGSTVGVPVLIPVAAGSLAAGAAAAIREGFRLRGERKAIEREASFSIGLDSQDPKVNLKFLGKLARFVYGATSRTEMLHYIVHQREASELLRGLTSESGLFADPTDLKSALPENISPDQVKMALRWLAETRVRLKATYAENRRFIRYSDQLSEAQQHALLAGTVMEVYERLAHLFSESGREDLKSQVLRGAEFKEFYNSLEEVLYRNLLGERQPSDPATQEALNLLGPEGTKALIEENESKAARDRAFRGLTARKVLHRGFGVAATSFAIGQAIQEARYQIQTRVFGQESQPSLIGNLLGEGKKAEIIPPSQEVVEYKDVHLRLPRDFSYNPETHELISPTGAKINLDDYLTSDGQLDLEKLSKVGLRLEGIFTVTETVHGPVSISDSDHNGMIDRVVINGQEINLTHQIDPTNPDALRELDGILREHGVTDDSLQSIHRAIEEGSHPETIEVPHIIEERAASLWERLGIKVKRQWYGYDQGGSQGNELRLYNSYQQVGTDDSGRPIYGVRLDMSRMSLGYQSGLNPNPIDVQEVIRNGEAVFSFVLPDGRTAIISGVDGQLFLNPLDTTHTIPLSDGSQITLGDFARMVLNQENLRHHIQVAGLGPSGSLASEFHDWQDVFNNVSYIEAARRPTEDGILQVFATIRGSGQPTPDLTIPVIREIITRQVPHFSGVNMSKVDILRENDVANLVFVEGGEGEFAVPLAPLPYSRYAEVGQRLERGPTAAGRSEARPTGGQPTQPVGKSPQQPSAQATRAGTAPDEVVEVTSRLELGERKRKIETVGRSEAGPRERDEDSYFDGNNFHFPELPNNILQLIANEGLSPNEVLKIYNEKRENGLIRSIAIVADGMGGHGNGEIASAVVTLAFVKKLCEKLPEDGTINENLLKTALQEAVALFKKILEDLQIKTNPGTTFVAQVTDKDSNVFVINIGDSRAYRIDKEGKVSLVTKDDSKSWSSNRASPSNIFIDPERNQLLNAITAQGSLTEDEIQVYQLSPLVPGEKIVLCCDGVWEDLNPNDPQMQEILKEAVTEVENNFAHLTDDDKIKAVMAYIFREANLRDLNLSQATIKAILDKLMKNHGRFSGDNITAVVIGY